jgi:hypothetical protein
MPFKKVLIVSPLKNEAQWITRHLKAWEKVDYPGDKVRWIILLGKSIDKTEEILLNYFEKHEWQVEIYKEPKFHNPTGNALYIADVMNEFKKYYQDEDFVVLDDGDIVKIPKNFLEETVALNKDIVAPGIWIENTNPPQFFDSVPPETPIILRDRRTKEIDILPIEDLLESFYNFDVLDDNGWTEIEKVTFHDFIGNLLRLRTIDSSIDITGNHSIYKSRNLTLTNASLLKVGDKLKRKKLRKEKEKGYKGKFFRGGEELGWLFGLFAAEGHASSYWNISNWDQEVLERAEKIMNKSFFPKVNRRNLYLESSSPKLASYFRNLFYTSSGKKKVPREILNAPISIKKAFLSGYNSGDGEKNSKSKYRFDTNSKTLAAGVCFLLRKLGEEYSLSFRKDKPEVTTTIVLKTHSHWKSKEGISLQEIYEIPFKGKLYDLTTKSNRFYAGLGPLLVHNTYVFRTLDGEKFPPFGIPYKDSKLPTEIGSVGTLVVMKGKVFKDVLFENPVPTLQFCKNARIAGYRIWFAPWIKVIHANTMEKGEYHMPLEFYVKAGTLPIEELEKVQ